MSRSIDFTAEFEFGPEPNRETVTFSFSSDDVKYATCAEIIDHLADIRNAGAKALAAKHVDYDIFSSDSDYLDTIDRVVAGMKLLSLRKIEAGKEPQRFYFEGVWPDSDDDGVYGDHIMAIDAEDAAFQGCWTMATHPDSGIEDWATEEDFSQVVAFMSDISVLMNHPEPVTKEDLIEQLQSIYSDLMAGETPSVDAIRDTLEKLDAMPSPNANMRF